MAKDDLIKRLKAVNAAKIDVMDGAGADFVKSLDKVLSRLNTRVQGLVGDLEGDKHILTSQRNLARAVNAQAQIEEMLLEAGYRDSVDGLMKSYDKVADIDMAGFRVAGINDPFSETDARAIVALKDLDLTRWERFGGDLSLSIQAQLLDAVVSGATFKELENAVEEALRGVKGDDPKVLRHARTIANTTTQGFDRTITHRKAATAKIDTFVYLGPDDGVTRPFCAAVLSGQESKEFRIPSVDGDPPIYTDEQISRMDNGQGLDVATYCGGYNCRHSFNPISVEKDEPEEQVAEEVLA